MSDDDLEYYRRRAATETARAEQAIDPAVARIHAELARAYRARVDAAKLIDGADRA